MEFIIGDIYTFEQIKVKVIEIKDKSIEFKVLEAEGKYKEGDFMEIPKWYIEEKLNKLTEDRELHLSSAN